MIKIKENPIEGESIPMGGFDLIVPALNFRQIKALKLDIKKMDEETDVDKKFAAQIKVIREAMKRNYPEIEISEVEDLVDMNNMVRVIMAVMGQSGAVLMGKPAPAVEV